MGDTSKNMPSFCEGLSILVVDNDEKSRMYLSSMLQQFSYEVTTSELATTALLMVEEQKDKFKLVIANVNIPDIDPLQFLHSLLIKEIPVILVSRNRSESYAKKMLAEGASFYLSEPIMPNDLKYLWQHAYRNKTIPAENADKIAMNNEEKSQNEVTENNSSVNGQKRQNEEKEGQNDKGKKAKITDEVKIIKCKSGKTRVVWTPELHLKFTEAISNLGNLKARPKPILELMNVKSLTSRQVASHLQKYRSTVQRIYENGIAEFPPATRTPSAYYKTSIFSNNNASSSSQHYHPSRASDVGVTGNLIDLVKAGSENGGLAMTAPIETLNQVPSWKKQEMDFLELIKSLDDGYQKVDSSNPENSEHQQDNNVIENSNYVSPAGENLGNNEHQQASNVVESSNYVSSAGEDLEDEDGFDEWMNEILNMDESEMPNLDLIMGSNEDMVNMAETNKIVDEPLPSDFDSYLKWAAQILLEDD